MAKIKDELILEDKFSKSLEKYIDWIGKAATRTENTQSKIGTMGTAVIDAVSKMDGMGTAATGAQSKIDTMGTSVRDTASKMGTMGAAVTDTASKTDKMAQDTVRQVKHMSQATQSLVEDLASYEFAAKNAFTDAQTDAALKELEKQMRRVGLAATTAFAEANQSELVMRNSLQELAENGTLAANAMAEMAHASRMEEEAEQSASQKTKEHSSALSRLVSGLKQVITFLPKHTTELVRNAASAAKARQEHDFLSKKLLSVGLMFLTAERMVRFLTDSVERAPKSIQKSWSGMVSGMKDTLARGFVAFLQGMQPAMDRFNQFMQSENGQRVMRGFESVMRLTGQAAGWLLDKITALGNFIGDNFAPFMEFAAIAMLVYAGNALLAAAATVAANIPLFLLIGLLAALIIGLHKAGVTSEQIFTFIGQAAGGLYAFVYNLVADFYNQIVIFAEFFANVFNDPVAAVAHLFFDTFDNILGMVETVAGAIDKLLGSNLAGAVSGFRGKLSDWVNDTFGENKIKIERMEKLNYTDTMDSFGKKAAGLSNLFSAQSLDKAIPVDLKSVAKSTKNIEKSVAMSEEDIKMLADLAERRYVNNINLTAQTPIINVSGQNTGDTAADRKRLGDTIRDILLEQVSSSSQLSTATVMQGG